MIGDRNVYFLNDSPFTNILWIFAVYIGIVARLLIGKRYMFEKMFKSAIS